MPNLLLKELARQEDLEPVREPRAVVMARKQEWAAMGRNAAQARYNTINKFNYSPKEILESAKFTNGRSLDKNKLKRIREEELRHYMTLYHRKRQRCLTDLPDHLKPF